MPKEKALKALQSSQVLCRFLMGWGAVFEGWSLRPSDEVEGVDMGSEAIRNTDNGKDKSLCLKHREPGGGGARWGCRAWKMRQVPGPIWSLARALES